MYNGPNSQQPPYNQSPYSSPYEQQYSQQLPSQPYPQIPYEQYRVPMVYPQPIYVPVPQPQPPKSNKTIWIVLGVLGGIFLLVVSVCGVSLYLGVQSARTFANNLHATSVASESSPQDQAQGYYLAISVQDYAGAYEYLAPNIAQHGTTLTQTAFTQQAQALDASEGPVSNYSATTDPTDASKVTVQVARSGGKNYTVNLTFTQGDFEWVISSFDTI